MWSVRGIGLGQTGSSNEWLNSANPTGRFCSAGTCITLGNRTGSEEVHRFDNIAEVFR